MLRSSRYGTAIPIQPHSKESSFVLDPKYGLKLDQPVSDLRPGQTPYASNFIVRDSSLEPRAMLQARNTWSGGASPHPASPIVGGLELSDTNGNLFPFSSYQTQPQWFSAGSWSVLSYTSAFGTDNIFMNSGASRIDLLQMYNDQQDENCVVWASPSYQPLFVWKSQNTVYSSLTGSPRALAVGIYDSYLIAGNIQDPTGIANFVQRVQWSQRGSMSSWTDGTSGFIDLLASKGPITKVLGGSDGRVMVFTTNEVWQLNEIGAPYVFQEAILEPAIGCPYPGTVVDTPMGVIFLGNDFQMYLSPRGGGQIRPITIPVHKELRTNIQNPYQAYGLYNRESQQYQLHYPASGQSWPQRALFFDLKSVHASFLFDPQNVSWLPQDYPVGLTAGWSGSLATTSTNTTWSALSTAGLLWNSLMSTDWYQLNAQTVTGLQCPYFGSSSGTVYSALTSATSDDGSAVSCIWRSHGIGGDDPTKKHTLFRLAIDYDSDSNASMLVRTTGDQGLTFTPDQQLPIVQDSSETQVVFYPYHQGRYPQFEIQVTNLQQNRCRISRFHTFFREQGR